YRYPRGPCRWPAARPMRPHRHERPVVGPRPRIRSQARTDDRISAQSLRPHAILGSCSPGTPRARGWGESLPEPPPEPYSCELATEVEVHRRVRHARRLTTPRPDDLGLTRLVNSSGFEISLLPNGAVFALEHAQDGRRIRINRTAGSPLAGNMGRVYLRIGGTE